ncbi:MAG: efflux RND transporter periplasmic adaptor subunit [Acidobacteriaceae bacterium]
MKNTLKAALVLITVLVVAAATLIFRATRARHNAPSSVVDALPTVTTVHPKPRSEFISLTLPATVSAWEETLIYAQVAGYMDRMRIDIGSRVRKGDVMAHIAVPELQQSLADAKARLEQAQASELQAEQSYHLKQLSYQRLAQVRKSDPDFVAQQDLDTASTESQVARSTLQLTKANVDSAKAQIGRLEALVQYSTIRAPFSGVVTQRSVNPGDLIQNSSSSNTGALPLFTVSQTDVVRVFLAVPEREVSFVDIGAPVTMQFDALPGRVFSGTITRFAGALDPQSRTMRAEIDLPNPKGVLKAGMFGSATVRLHALSGSVVLPSAALHQVLSSQSVTQTSENHSNYVYVVRRGKTYQVFVTPLSDDGIHVSVYGLSTADDVVVGASENLANGAAVQANTDQQNGSR